ncbi:MAG: hypothetical protein ACXVIJ_01845 [Thermoanaerobaculia bacterium]
MIAIAFVLGVVLPLLFLRRHTLRRCLESEAGAAMILFLAGRIVPPLNPRLAAGIVAAVIVGIVSIAVANGDDVRWSANRAALGALLVYLCVIPAMTRAPIDGDEPYYVLVTDSLLHDHDLDLRNQYRDSVRIAGRTLEPQPDDPIGSHGEQYSRHEPFLPLLLIPGYAAAGLPGALATIALFAALAVRSSVRLLEDEAIDDVTVRAVFPFVAFGPPLLFYSARIWPEAPAMFLFAEVLRGVRQRRAKRWIAALFALVLLKIRFILVAVMVAVRSVAAAKRRRRVFVPLLIAAAIAVPIVIVWAISGSVINVHSWAELRQFDPRDYARGLFGLALDGASGLLFQAPFFLLGIFALARWRSTPDTFRTGWFLSALYLFLLVPRSEWHGGWSPPLRYITFFMPVLALGAASIWNRVAAPLVALIAMWTAGVAIHGIAYPWRLFHIANGENAAGEWLSAATRADFSRLFPSFVRPNVAAIVASLILLIAILLFAKDWLHISRWIVGPIAAVAVLLAFRAGSLPANRIEFEDAHVTHRGGELYPPMYTVARFNYRGGWTLHAGESVSFLARGGRSLLQYSAPAPVVIQVGSNAYQLPAAKDGTAIVEIPRDRRVDLKCLSGTITLDAMRCQIDR